MHSIIFNVVLPVAIVLGAIVLCLAYWPRAVYVNDYNELVLKAVIGRAKIIPLAETAEYDLTDFSTKGMLRTNGFSLGKRQAGYFKKLSNGQKFYLFLTGKYDKKGFIYQDRIYVVDDWTQNQ